MSADDLTAGFRGWWRCSEVDGGQIGSDVELLDPSFTPTPLYLLDCCDLCDWGVAHGLTEWGWRPI